MPATITPYLILRNAADALAWYAEAFGATEAMRLAEPGTGRIGHAEIDIDGARVMLADEFPEMELVGPASRGGTTITLALEVDDVDAVTARAAAAGGTVLREPTNEFHGDRSSRLRDPFGHIWHISTRIEDVTAEEMQRRYDELLGGNGMANGESSEHWRPEAYNALSPYLIVAGAEREMAFLEKVFDVERLRRFETPDGSVMHAELRVADTVVMLGDAGGDWPPVPCHLHVYVPDVDAVYRRALEAGGESVQEPVQKDAGDDRRGGVRSPGGNTWWIATRVS